MDRPHLRLVWDFPAPWSSQHVFGPALCPGSSFRLKERYEPELWYQITLMEKKSFFTYKKPKYPAIFCSSRHLLGPDYTETFYSPGGEEITTSPQNMVGSDCYLSLPGIHCLYSEYNMYNRNITLIRSFLLMYEPTQCVELASNHRIREWQPRTPCCSPSSVAVIEVCKHIVRPPKFYNFDEGMYSEGKNNVALVAVMSHELGHVLGMPDVPYTQVFLWELCDESVSEFIVIIVYLSALHGKMTE
ncbi:ADAM DEC1 [Camelus dromedarius]|uniref:ADAM DEC1 n=1 Tax=Camelus dromedarius TaxID=9838 RepID=A0A5N4CB39_CAMDR|nr:ADAM DEC1 [Camelus dromedarius]